MYGNKKLEMEDYVSVVTEARIITANISGDKPDDMPPEVWNAERVLVFNTVFSDLLTAAKFQPMPEPAPAVARPIPRPMGAPPGYPGFSAGAIQNYEQSMTLKIIEKFYHNQYGTEDCPKCLMEVAPDFESEAKTDPD